MCAMPASMARISSSSKAVCPNFSVNRSKLVSRGRIRVNSSSAPSITILVTLALPKSSAMLEAGIQKIVARCEFNSVGNSSALKRIELPGELCGPNLCKEISFMAMSTSGCSTRANPRAHWRCKRPQLGSGKLEYSPRGLRLPPGVHFRR
jgi:hypothetical protein